MANTLNQQIRSEIYQYKLEVQNKELQAQIMQANHTIEMQNQHIEQIFGTMNILIGIMGLFVAIFGIIIPLWNAWNSKKMKEEVEEAVKDTNSFIANKYKEWENAEADNAIKRYQNNEISWQDLHSILKYKPLNFKQMSEIYNTAVSTDNTEMVECLTCYTFNEHLNNTSDEYNKIRNLIVNSKYFPLFAYKLNNGVKNALLYISDKQRENIINQSIDCNLVPFLCNLKNSTENLLSFSNKNHIVNKIIKEKIAAALNPISDNKELIDLLINNGLFNDLVLNDLNSLTFKYGISIITPKANSYFAKKVEEFTIKEITKKI